MKKVLLCVLSLVLISGCSGLVRQSGMVPIPSDPWKKVNGVGVETSCGDLGVSVGYISYSDLAIIGPLIPIVPIGRSDGGSVYVMLENESICPFIQTGNGEFKATANKSALVCHYNIGKLGVDREVRLIFNEGVKCSLPPIRYEEKIRWFYTPLLSA